MQGTTVIRVSMPRSRSKLSKKTPNTFGVNPRTHPLSVREYVDYDYLGKLSEEEKLWLSAFSDVHYAADFRDNPFDIPKDARRKTYRAKNAANKDAYARADGWGLVLRDVDVLGEEQELEAPTPQYLSAEAYKALLVEYRSALDQKPKDEALVEKLRKRLLKFSQQGQSNGL